MYNNSIKHLIVLKILNGCIAVDLLILLGGGRGSVGEGKGRDMSVAWALFDYQKIQLKEYTIDYIPLSRKDRLVDQTWETGGN